MRILSYSPSVEAYIEHDGTVIDVSNDIVKANVNRRVDAASSFTIELQNKNRKYNGRFTPMDKIVIYATKDKRYKLLTGYVNSVSAFTLYPKDFVISGYCTIYRLQQLYWDSNLVSSQKLKFIPSGKAHN